MRPLTRGMLISAASSAAGGREHDACGGAAAGLRLDRERAADGLGRLARDREAEPEPAAVALEAVEAVEHARLHGRRDAGPGVRDLDRRLRPVLLRAQHDLAGDRVLE